MSTDFNNSLDTSLQSESKLTQNSGKVARFAYTQQAFDTDTVAGTESYNYNQEQNIPLADSEILQISDTILSKGLRSQASSFTRMGVNHFFGRCSYNINKLASHLKALFETLISFMREGDNAWSPTVEYKVGDVVYIMTTLNYKQCKRTFVCIVDCPSVNLPPVYTDGSLINTTYWKEAGNIFGGMEVNGASVLNGDLTVNGNITQSGTTYVTHAEQIYTKKDNIITREDATTGLASGKYSGIKVTNYDGNGTDGVLAYRSDGTAVVGDYTEGNPPSENLQPLLTRPDEGSPQLQNGGVLVWNNTTKRAETTNLPTAITLTVNTNTMIQDYTTNVMVKVNGSGVTLTMGAITDFGEVTVFALYDTIIAFNGMTDILHAYETCRLQYINGTWFVISNESAGDIKASASDEKPFGSLICDGTALTGTDETKYLRLWKKLTVSDGQGGEKGKYNLPTDPSTIRRLPDLRNRTIMGANPDVEGKADGNTSNVGDVQKAQLPNIKGDCITAGEYALSTVRDNRPTYMQGAFKFQLENPNYYLGRGGSGYQGSYLHFDASNKSSSYSASIDHLGNNVYYGDFNNSTEANRTFGEVRSANIRMNWFIKY